MITYWLPVRRPSTLTSPSSDLKFSEIGGLRSSSIRARLSSSANQSAIPSARSGPMPSHSTSSSGVAAISRSMSPKWRARFCALIQPILSMFRPARMFRNGIVRRETSIASIALRAEISP